MLRSLACQAKNVILLLYWICDGDNQDSLPDTRLAESQMPDLYRIDGWGIKAIDPSAAQDSRPHSSRRQVEAQEEKRKRMIGERNTRDN
jgi:hypothetical protein